MWSSSSPRQKRICSSASSPVARRQTIPSGRCQATARPSGRLAFSTPSLHVLVASEAPASGKRERVRPAWANVGGDHGPRIVTFFPDMPRPPRPCPLGAGATLHVLSMRRTWDALAAGETAVYVGDPASGAEELAGLFGRLGADPRGGRCVEVGCGPGRMTGALAERFDEVVAARRLAGDARAGPRERARRRTSRFGAVSGERLDGVEDGSADTLVCYLVLQHLPSARGRPLVSVASSPACSRLPARRSSRSRCSTVGSAAPAGRFARRSSASPAGPTTAPPSAATASPLRARPRVGRGPPPRGARGRRPVRVSLLPRPLPAARPRMTAAALVVYALLLAATIVAVFRRPIVALYVFVARPPAPQHRHVAALRRRRARPRARRDPGLEGDRARRGRRLGRGLRDPGPASPVPPHARRLARARVRRVRRPVRADPAERPRRPRRNQGDRLRAPPRPRPRRRVLPRPLCRARRAPDSLADRVRRGGRRRLGPDRGLRRPDRVVAPLRRGRLLPPRARLRLPRPRRPARELRVQHERRPLPAAGLDLRLAARDGVHARDRAAPARDRAAAAPARRRARRALRRRPALDVLALVDRRARGRPPRARRRPPPLVAGGRGRARASPPASASPRSSTTSPRARTGSRPTSRTRRPRRRRRARCRRGAASPAPSASASRRSRAT